MKRTILLIFTFVFSTMALAASGTATFAPFENYIFSNDNFKRAYINVSNITGETVTVSFTLYDEAGNMVTDANGTAASGPLRAQYNFTNYSDSLTDKSAQFDLPPYSTARLHVEGTSNPTMMFGNIEWTQNSKASVAVIASMEVNRFYRSGHKQSAQTQTVSINNGLPF